MHPTARAVAPLNTDPKWPQGYIAVYQLRSPRLFHQSAFADEGFVNNLDDRFK